MNGWRNEYNYYNYNSFKESWLYSEKRMRYGLEIKREQ